MIVSRFFILFFDGEAAFVPFSVKWSLFADSEINLVENRTRDHLSEIQLRVLPSVNTLSGLTYAMERRHSLRHLLFILCDDAGRWGNDGTCGSQTQHSADVLLSGSTNIRCCSIGYALGYFFIMVSQTWFDPWCLTSQSCHQNLKRRVLFSDLCKPTNQQTS